MKRDVATQSMGISFLGMFTGFVLLFFAVNFGHRRAQSWINAKGSASPEEYAVIVEQSILVFIVLGGVLLAASLLWTVLLLVKNTDIYGISHINNQVAEKE